MTSDPDVPGAPPELSALEAIPPPIWDRLLPHVRASLLAVADEALNPMIRRLRAAPHGRLRSGRVRRDLFRALAEGGALWVALRARLRDDDELASLWREAMATRETRTGPDPEPAAAESRDDDRILRAKDRARSLKAQRDELARQVEGANARAEVAEQARDQAEAQMVDLRDEIAELRAELDSAARARADEVDRERRRRDREVEQLREELRAARRSIESLRRDLDQARAEAAASSVPAPEPQREPTTQFVQGRPSELPDDLVPGTTEHSRALLPRGRTVLIDGYNVTRTHRGDLGLTDQREWLIGLASGAAGRLGLSLTLVFDGAEGSGISSTRTRGIRVEYSRDGMSADDDLVFLVAAMPDDEPITVVTDDVELTQRLAPYRVDLLGTRQFLWAVG